MANDFYSKAVAITTSDTVNIPGPNSGASGQLTDAVYVGGAGIVVAVFQDDTTVNFTAVAGEIIPIRIKRVNSTNTTATLMVALYAV
jgi:hypothetical protein